MSLGGSGLNLQDGMDLSGMTYDELWIRHIGLGGTASQLEVEGFVLDLLPANPYEHDIIAQAINEYFLERGEDHPVGYWSSEVIPEQP